VIGVDHEKSGSLIASISVLDPFASLAIEGSVDGSGSGSLSATDGSIVDGTEGAESSGSDTDSG
jgi:hypothetical protein